MGDVVWVCVLEDGQISADEFDRPELVRHARRLDKICSRLDVPLLSSFFHPPNTPADLREHGRNGPEGTRDVRWYDAQEGLRTVEALLADLRERPIRIGLFRNRRPEVLKELTACVDWLEDAVEKGHPFNLSIVR